MRPTPPRDTREMLDRMEIFQLVQSERISRDAGRWDDLQSSYWPDARVRVTWFDGGAEDFVRRSREQFEGGKGQGSHDCVPINANVIGDRALVESLGGIQVRSSLDGIEIDIDHWCRWLCRAERRGDEWRLCQYDAVYGKDRLQAVRPDQQVAIDWDLAEPLRPSYRWLAYLNVANGYPYEDALPGSDRPDLIEDFESESAVWLAGG